MNQPGGTQRSAAVCGLRSVHIGVIDFDRALDFFTRVWGLSTVTARSGLAYLRATGPDHHVVALYKRPHTEVLRIDLRAPIAVQIDAIHARLASRGAEGLTNPAMVEEAGGGYGFSVCDPDGRPLLIVAGDKSHADVVETIDKPRKLSHVVLNTPDAAAVEEFYINGLGFRLVDRTKRMSFINCNADHHSIAIVPSQSNTLNHIAFEMPGFDAVMRGIGRLRDAGFEIGWGVGRHGPGNNIFAYFAGIERLPLEYTAEVQQIDDSYRVGSPEDWKPLPGRMDQWGATSAPSQVMVEAEHSIGFSSESLSAST
jgi:catechol 2,3-dioxygenase-like lactoylglutathione lyase family enzyme